MDIGDFADVPPGNVAHLYDETARTYPDRLALEMDGEAVTHAELRDRSARFAGGLHELGFDPGDRIAIYLPNSPAFVATTLGAFKAGLPFVPMNPKYTAREIAHQIDDSDAAAVITTPDLRERVATALATIDADPRVIVVGGGETAIEYSDATGDADGAWDDRGDIAFESVDGEPIVVDRRNDDVALQPYTSGTTGDPKGVLLTHRNVRAQSLVGFERTNLDAEEERFLSILPLSHIAGFINRTWQPLVRGASVYIRDPEDWTPESVMATIEEHSITKFGAVTTIYLDMINHDSFGAYDLSSLAEAMEGGSKMPTEVQERFETATGVELFEAYGLTETGGGTHVGFDSTFGPKHGSVGQPLRATDCKIVDKEGNEVPTGDTGELLVRGPHVMSGYHESPEATAEAFTEDGYFRTGDVARRDEDNYYEIVDRKSDVIVTAGYNVYPKEVEGVLHGHPAVVDAAVVGVPDKRRNSTVKAYVIADDESVSADALREYCLDRLAAYKHPREIEFVETLPRTASGKVQKFELEETVGH